MKSLIQSSKYRKFITERDRALEKILSNHHKKISNILHEALERILEIVSYRYGQIEQDTFFTSSAMNILSIIHNQLYALNIEYRNRITLEVINLRRIVYALTYTAELEAISQALGKENQAGISKADIYNRATANMHDGSSLLGRVDLYLNRLSRKVIDAIDMARVNQENVNEMLDRVKKVFPKVENYRKPPVELKRLHEAEEGVDLRKKIMTTDFLSDEDWNEIVDAYKIEVLPATRFFNEIPVPDDVEKRYAWELEKDITHDFVDLVRKGQIGAANDAGIKEFIWIAILDDKTDECCAWRDGLTISEIEGQLKGKHRDDECESTVPPAHFNCRCTLAPVVGEIPERVESNLGDFQSWLES